ncbi:MAG: hypothetical protein ABIK97_00860 [candidate division WOR-3 bacterium]
MREIFIFSFLLFLFCYPRPKSPPPLEIVNGEFNEDWNFGWRSKVENHAGDYEIRRVKVDKEYHIRVYKSLCGSAQIYQVIKIPNLAATLSFRAKFFADSNIEEYAAAAGIVIEYLNSAQRKLGATYFYSATPNFQEWQNSPTTHLYKVSPADWQRFSLDIKKELRENLSGIEREEVKYIKITLLAYCTQKEGC